MLREGSGRRRAGPELSLAVRARPGRGCSQSPRSARPRRWAVRRGRFLRRRRGEPGMERVRLGRSARTAHTSRRPSLKTFPAPVPGPVLPHLLILIIFVPRRAANLNFHLLSRRRPA